MVKNLALAALALSCCYQRLVSAEELCSIVPQTYPGACTTYPQLASAIKTLEQYSITAWYTDRLSEADRSTMLSDIKSKCSEETRMTIAVYGLPSKDCNAGLSSGGSVHSTSDYKAFLSKLTTSVGTRKVLYVVEPDAVGLLVKGGCGEAAGYLDNLKIAVAALSQNPNAQLYVDVGYWELADASSASAVAAVMKELSGSGKVKGVTINTSNYRSIDECATYCTNFQTAMGSTDMTCAVDTSRNYVKPTSTDWCNVPTAGIGKPPTSKTGISNLDYFMWIKPPGESDGECSGGTGAGSFFSKGFQLLWDQGYFVAEKNMPKIGASNSSSPSTPRPSENPDQTDHETPAPTPCANQDDNVGTVGPADPTRTEAPVYASSTQAPTYSPTTEPTPIATPCPQPSSSSEDGPGVVSPADNSPIESPSPVTQLPVLTSAVPDIPTSVLKLPMAKCRVKQRVRRG